MRSGEVYISYHERISRDLYLSQISRRASQTTRERHFNSKLSTSDEKNESTLILLVITRQGLLSTPQRNFIGCSDGVGGEMKFVAECRSHYANALTSV